MRKENVRNLNLNNKSEKKVIVFSGYNMRAIIAFIRTIDGCDVDFDIVALSEDDYILKTVYKSHVKYIRSTPHLDINEVCRIVSFLNPDNKKVFIAPSTEFLNRFLLDNREILERNNCIIPLVDKKTYEIVSDKATFAALCFEYGIRIPSTYDEIEEYVKPIVAKPKQYVSSDGKIYAPVFLDTKEKFKYFIENHKKEDFSFQEMLGDGECIYLLFYFDKCGEVNVISQRNLLQQRDGKSIVAAISSKYHEETNLIKPYIEMFENLGFRGLVMVEIRRIDDVDYMIEANPRFWGPSQLFCDMGYNLFELLLYDYGIIDHISLLDKQGEATYFWEGGISDLEMLYKHKGFEELFSSKNKIFLNNEIYRRNDTMVIYQVEKLKKLYMESSKHSNYQILATCVNRLINIDDVAVNSRFERERMDYIQSKLDLRGKNILDIGGNTGFFSFESLDANVNHVDYYEGNIAHAEFVGLASNMLGLDAKISVHPEYYSFSGDNRKYDIVYNLNVIHHLGADFGDEYEMIEAKNKMAECINNMANTAEYMVFQMGFNWKGNRSYCLFTNGTKAEMIGFIKDVCRGWEIVNIGVASKDNNGNVYYSDLDENNILRNDLLGEFLNRPIFILKKASIL